MRMVSLEISLPIVIFLRLAIEIFQFHLTISSKSEFMSVMRNKLFLHPSVGGKVYELVRERKTHARARMRLLACIMVICARRSRVLFHI